MMIKNLSFSVVVALAISTSMASAAPIKGKAPSGFAVMAISDGKADTSSDDSRSFNLSAASTKGRLYLLKDGSVAAPVIAAVKYKGEFYSLSDAKSEKICRKGGAKLIMGLKSSAKTVNVGAVKVNSNDGVGYLAKLPESKYLDGSSATTIANKNKCYPAATGATLGLATTGAQAAILADKITLKATAGDEDGDGLLDPLDIDEDGDGILNGYDADSTSGEVEPGISEPRIFSNLKLGIEGSLNLYTSVDGTLSETEINTAAGQIGLAMQVAGGNTNTTELDCGSLNYCSTGGTGRYNNQPFPDSFDSDADGLGEMTIGGTGDFQLSPLVTTASSINAGDAFVEVVTDGSSNETSVPALLNFVFRTTPAIKSLTMGGATSTITYPATGSMAGTPNNPIVAPVSWDGLVTIVAYRPQRPGVSAAGEADYVDLGNSKISVDIPNAPCATSTSGGCSGAGPGNCVISSYTTTDANLTTDGDTLRDNRGDVDSNFANPTDALVTFTLNLDACLADESLTLGASQKVALDLQFRSDDGDNAAQKFYIARP